MMQMFRVIAGVCGLAVLVVAGCTSPNPAFCRSAADCPDPDFPICDSSISGCVGTSDGGVNGGDDSDGGDQGPRENIWVAADCAGEGTGTQADPFCSLSRALEEVAAGGRIVINGEVELTAAAVIADDLTLEGAGEARVEHSSCPVITVADGARVLIRGLHIGLDGSGGTGGAVQAVGGAELLFEDGLINDTHCVGLRCFEATCELLRSEVSGNSGGGVWARSATIRIINSLIVDNGETGQVGGVTLEQPLLGSAFIHNTVAYNANQAEANAGVSCSGDPVEIENSILWGNEGAEVSACPVSYSALSQELDTFTNLGGNQIDVDPLFVEDGEDFHLQPGSPCRNAANPNPSLQVGNDIDGEPRSDGLPDMGADEVH
jgi:hypothetical protein